MYLKKLVLKIHLLLGISSGLVIIILGLTGCLYVFIDELRTVFYQDQEYVTHLQEKKLPLSELLELAQDTLGEKKNIRRIGWWNNPERTYTFISGGVPVYRKSAENEFWYWDGVDYAYSVFVNPYSGDIQSLRNDKFDFFTIVFWLHYSLLLTPELGQPIVGVATLTFLILLFTGLLLWWPHNKKARKMRTWFRWKPTTRWKRKNYDIHSILGFYSMSVSLIIALTGLMWAFDWFSDGVEWLASGGKFIQDKEEIVQSNPSHIPIFRPLDKVYQDIQEEYPNAIKYRIDLPKDSRSPFIVYLENASAIDKLLIAYDQYSGEPIKTMLSIDDVNAWGLIDMIKYPVHVGSIFGLPSKLLAFFASLFSASLPITGFLIWYGRRYKIPKWRVPKNGSM